MPDLQIYDARERWLVRSADAALVPLRWFRGRPSPRQACERVLLLRLERIGDLLMVLEAVSAARRAWPKATIDLAVGSWNAPIARLIPEISRFEIIDAPWLARDARGDSWPTLVRKARALRGYDVVINFEPDIRSNALAWLTGAPRRVGYSTGGGAAFLTDAVPYDPSSHVAVNARRLVARVAAEPDALAATAPLRSPRLQLPEQSISRARALIGSANRPLAAIHASGGRESKQWHVDRFAAVGRALSAARGATIVLTGTLADRPLIDEVRQDLPGVAVVDAGGLLDLPALAALLGEVDVFITGDTGPMHLAAAMGTPIVALFGPSDPRRYGPNAAREVILRVDLPCSPCGQVRLPPVRCRGHVPECLDRITTDEVVAAALKLLDSRGDGQLPAQPA